MEVKTMEKTPITKEDVDNVINVILEEGRERGYQDAAAVYTTALKKVAKRARVGGFVLGALTFGGAALGVQIMHCKKKDEEEAKKKEKKMDWEVI